MGEKTAVYGIFLHHTRQLLLSGITHAPLILSYEIIFLQRYCGVIARSSVHGTVLQNLMDRTKSDVRDLRFRFSWDPSLQQNDIWTFDGSVHGN